jgi:hypothetical protein
VSIPVNRHDFPFDKQTFFIQTVSRGYSPSDILFKIDQNMTGRATEVSLSGWKMGDIKIREINTSLRVAGGNRSLNLAGFRIEIEGIRNWQYYLLREILALIFIVLMPYGVFWIPAKELGSKIGVSTAAIFSLMAYYIQLGRSIPKIDYLTRMDYFLVGSTILVFAGFAQVIVGMYFIKKDQLADLARMEKWFRVIYPSLFLLVLLFTVAPLARCVLFPSKD